MRVNLKWKPKTLVEHVLFYSFCLVLELPIWLHSRVLLDGMIAVSAVIVVGVVGLLVMRRGAC